jgi:adenylate kinase
LIKELPITVLDDLKVTKIILIEATPEKFTAAKVRLNEVRKNDRSATIVKNKIKMNIYRNKDVLL